MMLINILLIRHQKPTGLPLGQELYPEENYTGTNWTAGLATACLHLSCHTGGRWITCLVSLETLKAVELCYSPTMMVLLCAFLHSYVCVNVLNIADDEGGIRNFGLTIDWRCLFSELFRGKNDEARASFLACEDSIYQAPRFASRFNKLSEGLYVCCTFYD